MDDEKTLAEVQALAEGEPTGTAVEPAADGETEGHPSAEDSATAEGESVAGSADSGPETSKPESASSVTESSAPAELEE